MGCTTRCNTSILVDDILFDVGMGTVKQIERLKIYTKSIKIYSNITFSCRSFFGYSKLFNW